MRLPRGVVEGGAALGILEVKLRAALDEREGRLGLAEDTGVDQRRPAVFVSLVNADISVQKKS